MRPHCLDIFPRQCDGRQCNHHFLSGAPGEDGTLIMLSTGLGGLVSMFRLIPTTKIVNKPDTKKAISISWYIAFWPIYLWSLGIFRNGAGKVHRLCGMFLLLHIQTPVNEAWHLLLTNMQLPSERGDFFGFMRFSYYILTWTVFLAIGAVMGEWPLTYSFCSL